jgi:hypothetical protein
MKQLLLFVGLFICAQTLNAQVSYTWNGSVSSAWNTAANWTPNGVPGAADNVTIVAAGNNCVLNTSQSINNFTLTSGVMDLNSMTLTINGTTVSVLNGNLQNGVFTVTGANTTVFGGTSLTVNTTTSVTSATISIKNTNFQNVLSINKTGASNDASSGNNVFGGATQMTNAGAGYLMMGNGNPDKFNSSATFNNTGSSSIYVAYNSSNNIFNGITTFNNTPAANTAIYIGWYGAGTQLNNDINVSSNNGQGIQFCGGNNTASATLAAGKAIKIGAGGFSAGVLSLRQFTQLGSLPITLAGTGSAQINLGPSSTFNSTLDINFPNIYPFGSLFNAAVTLTKNDGTNSNATAGGNTFNSTLTVNYFSTNGTGYWSFGNGAPDIYNGVVYSNNNSLDRIIFGHNSSNNQFNSNLVITQQGASQGTALTWNGGSSTVMAAGGYISIGTAGLNTGYLFLQGFTQNGNTPNSIATTGNAAVYVGTAVANNPSVFGGSVSITAADIYLRGGTFNGPVQIKKTGGSYDHNNQYQNIFNSTLTIYQYSNGGYFMLGYNSNDIFNDDIFVSSSGSGGIYLGYTSGTGTPTLAAGKSVYIGSENYTAGPLVFGGFTQLGNKPINLTLTGTTTSVQFSKNSQIGGNLQVTSPDLYFNGCTFNGSVDAIKTGPNGNWGQGGNTFNGLSSFTNNGNGYLLFGGTNPDTWNNDVTFTNNGTDRILPGWSSAGNLFNGNITVNNSAVSAGINFCGGATTATATLSAGKNIQIGAGGFSNGYLILQRFTQLGNSPSNLTLTGTSTYLQVGPSSAIGGDFTAVSPRILLNGAVYTGNVNLTKNGSVGDWSYGGNTFNGTTTINMVGSAYFGFANAAPDIYNGDLYVNNNSTDRVIFGNVSSGNQFNGNIILTQTGSSQGIAFGWNASNDATLAAGKTISIGAAGFDVGYLQIERFTQLGNTPVNLPLTGTASLTFGPTSTIGGDLTSTSASLYFNGCTFNGKLNSIKNGTTNDWSSGTNVFNADAVFTNAGDGYLLFGGANSDQFKAASTFNNVGNSYIYVAHNSANNIFGGVATFNNAPTANTYILVSWNSAGTVFNDNVVVTSTNGQGVQFCGATTATVTLAANKTISVGAAGFSAGTLMLRRFTQLGATAQNLTLTGTGNLTFGPASSFDGDITTVSPALFFNGCVFNGSTNCTKNGSSGDWSQGGNTFNGISTITNSGTSYLLFGGTNPDTWNNDVTFTNNGSERLLPAWSSVGNLFNGNVYVNTDGSAQGIQFCGGNSTATATLAATKSIMAGSTGLNAGYLILRQFTELGNAPVNLTLSNTATYLQYGPGSSFGGNVNSTSPGLYFHGATFNGLLTATKNGFSNDWSQGNNIFNGTSNITNAGSGYLLFGGSNADQFNAASTFNNIGSSYIYVAYNSANNIFGGTVTFNNMPTANTYILVSWYSAGTLFNDNIIVNSTNGQGVQFCGATTASAILASGKTISVGATGFSAGALVLRRFTQLGATPQNLTLTGNANLTFGPGSSFGGNIVSVSPTLFYNGCNFDGIVNASKNGGTNDASPGTNNFNGPFTITNTGSGYFLMGNGNPDTWQSSATFNNYSNGQHMYTAYNSTGNVFNGNVTYNNQPGSNGLWIYPNYYGLNTLYNGNIQVNNVNGGGVYFGSGTGTATLSSGNKISIGANGFNYGSLIFRNFTQTGSSTSQNITTTGTSNIQYNTNTSFDGPVTSSSPGLFFNGTTFNGIVNCTKTGSTNDQSQGNNIFNAPSTFINNGAGYLMMTNNTSDAYNSDVSFVKNGSGLVYPNYNNNSVYLGNLTVNSSTPITFGAGNGTATFAGNTLQNFYANPGTPSPVFTRMVISNTGQGVTLYNTNISVSGNLLLSTGFLNTSSNYMLTMLNGSSVAAGNATSTSYVNGPMRYQKSSSGYSTLNFPVGNGADCRPVVITVNHANNNLYTYQTQLFNSSAAALGYTLPITVDKVSYVHYYTINRLNASNVSQPSTDLTGNQTIQVFFGPNDAVSNGATLTIVKNTYNNPTKWTDIGGTGAPAYAGGTSLTGSVTSTSVPNPFNSFSTFALGDNLNGKNVLPVELLYFNASANNNRQVNLTWATSSETNNSYFTVEKSNDGANFEYFQKISSKGINGNSSLQLDYSTIDSKPFSGVTYYRLKQTDLNGKYAYSAVRTVNMDNKQSLAVYPNPSAGTVYVNGLDKSANSVNVEWFDLAGRSILQQTATVQSGVATLNTNLKNGAYILRIKNTDGSFIIQNIIITR